MKSRPDFADPERTDILVRLKKKQEEQFLEMKAFMQALPDEPGN